MQGTAATKDLMALCAKIVLLFSIFSTSFCCNTGWSPFEDVCYRVSQHLYDVELAKRYCQLSGGQLAYINKSDTLSFLNTIPNYNGMQEYWIDEGSAITDSSASDNTTVLLNCAYAKILDIKREFCNEKKYFICQVKEEKSPDVCPLGFDKHGTHCYRPLSNKANYEDAKKFCVLQQSRLAILDSEAKEWEAKAVIIGRNQTFMLDAKKSGDVLKWGNGELLEREFKSFNPDLEANETLPERRSDCVGILSESDHPTMFSWVYLDCDEKFNFLCEVDPVMTTTPRPTTTTTQPPSLQCPHGMNWKSHEKGFCYWETTYETDRLNWFQAREFCKSYGGDLASYENEEQENAGLGGARGHFRGLWIGLKKDENDVFHWVDGTPLSYTNWDWDEPNRATKSKFCVTHASGSSKWELDYCGVRRWFICKAPKVRNPVHTDRFVDKKQQCDVKGVSTYRNQWYMYEDHCYLVQETRKYTWDTAQQFCQDNDALLASMHSFNETNFILTLMSIFPENDFWIGLSAHGLSSSFMWSDNTTLDFLYWGDNKTDAEGLNRCVTFNKKDGSWSTDHCNRLQLVICKRGINASYDFTTTEPTTVMPGNCENGWYNFGNKCYKYFGRQWSQRVQWTTAKQKCEEIGTSLASIHSQAEQDLLTDVVLEANTNLWIGLQSRDEGTIYHWNDDSRIDYTNWNSNEPGYNSDSDMFIIERSKETCVEMEFGEKSIGKWNAISCSKKKGYLCEKMKDPTLTKPYEDPFICPNISGWYRLGTSCYGFFEDQQLTWLQSQAECRKYGADLITYISPAVPIFIKRRLKLKDGYIWIGARETKTDKYEYLPGSPIFFTDWVAGQPQSASTLLDNCVSMTTAGGWVVKSCKEKHPFICRFSPEAEPVPKVDRTSSCDGVKGDWYDFGGENCYMLVTDVRLTWGDALHYCFKHGGFLASFHSVDEIKELQNQITYDSMPPSLHIGLGKKYDGSFTWVDSSPLDFINWEEGEPDQVDKQCAEMSMASGKWNDIDCDDTYRGYICSYRKRTVRGVAMETSSNSTQEKETISQKFTAGAIFGFILCVLVILAIIGMTVYYLRPTKQVQPKLLETENL